MYGYSTRGSTTRRCVASAHAHAYHYGVLLVCVVSILCLCVCGSLGLCLSLDLSPHLHTTYRMSYLTSHAESARVHPTLRTTAPTSTTSSTDGTAVPMSGSIHPTHVAAEVERHILSRGYTTTGIRKRRCIHLATHDVCAVYGQHYTYLITSITKSYTWYHTLVP